LNPHREGAISSLVLESWMDFWPLVISFSTAAAAIIAYSFLFAT
jgi:hypothetical protein